MRFFCFAFFFTILTSVSAMASEAQKTYVVIGDSIMSLVGDGQSKDHALTLVASERDVMFKNISSPGASLGGVPPFGFNSALVTSELTSLLGVLDYFDGIIVQAGVNDFSGNMPWSTNAESLNRILDYARAHNKKVLMLDLLWMWNEANPNSTGWILLNYRIARSMVCASYPDVCVFAPRPAEFDRPSTTLFAAADVDAGKQLHPNVIGHRIYANWLASVAASAGLF